MNRCKLAHVKTYGQHGTQASCQSVLIWTRGSAACRGDDLLVSQVLTHLLRTLPLSVGSDTGPRMGIAERVQQLQAAMVGHDVGVVGLHGMGGIGKTTLAKAFYAEQANLPAFARRVLLHVGREAEGNTLRIR